VTIKLPWKLSKMPLILKMGKRNALVCHFFDVHSYIAIVEDEERLNSTISENCYLSVQEENTFKERLTHPSS